VRTHRRALVVDEDILVDLRDLLARVSFTSVRILLFTESVGKLSRITRSWSSILKYSQISSLLYLSG
jgi:hypothetical protein